MRIRRTDLLADRDVDRGKIDVRQIDVREIQLRDANGEERSDFVLELVLLRDVDALLVAVPDERTAHDEDAGDDESPDDETVRRIKIGLHSNALLREHDAREKQDASDEESGAHGRTR